LKKNKISKNWINKQNRDIYVRKSKDQGYRSRSAFKLIEIDQRFHFLSKTRSLLDLGSAPGSWSQVVSKKIKNGKILSVDIKEMLPISNTIFLKGDFTELKIQKKIIKFFNTKIDTMISDMASNTTGNKELDSLRTGNLCLNALEFSRKILKTNAYFVSKIFMGAIFKEIQFRAKEIFKEVLIFKPKSSRKESREIYVICRNLKVIND
jgi:23S rRNA (uridine2552-2'-O)-methyltransferase